MEIKIARKPLENPGFVTRAPAEVVERARRRLAQFEAQREELVARHNLEG